jgi:hypothetical protein
MDEHNLDWATRWPGWMARVKARIHSLFFNNPRNSNYVVILGL